MLEMFLQVRVQDHVVLVVAEDVRLSVPGDGAELDRQGPAAAVLEVVHSVVVAAASVKELSSASDDAVRQI